MDSIRSVVCWAFTLVLFYSVCSNLQANAEPRWPLPEGIKSAEVNGYDMACQEAGSGPVRERRSRVEPAGVGMTPA
jgi:hypothetical protein